MLCLLLWGLPSTEDPLGTLPIMTVTHLSPSEALQAGHNGWFNLCPLLSYLCDSPHTTSPTWNVLPSPLRPIHPSIWQSKCHLFHEVLLNSPKGNELLPSLLSRSNLLLSNLFFIDLSYAFIFLWLSKPAYGDNSCKNRKASTKKPKGETTHNSLSQKQLLLRFSHISLQLCVHTSFPCCIWILLIFIHYLFGYPKAEPETALGWR